MDKLKKSLSEIGLIPVIKISDASKAIPLAEALIEGNLPAVEITFRTDAAVEVIEKIHHTYPDMLIGAGTVLTPGQLHDAVMAGASFVVSPGCNPKTLEAAQKEDIPMIPGCMTPSEMEMAITFGLDVVKFFPAEAAGGVKLLTAVSAPYAGLSFMPTGGITMDNLSSYLSLKNVLCCGGSFVAEEKDIVNGDFAAIRRKAAETASAIAVFRN